EILGCPEEARPFIEALDTLADFTIIDLPACYYEKRGNELFFDRDFPSVGIPAGPEYFATGFTGDDRVDLPKVFSVGFLVDNGQPFTWRQSEPQHGKCLFRGTQEAPVFPAGIVGLKDRGTERFRAALTGAKGNWTPSHGHAILPIVFARLGMREELRKYLLDFPSLYQHFPQGFFNYKVFEDFYPYLHDQYSLNQVRDADHPEDSEHPFRKPPFVHFAFDTSGVFCAALTEMLLQSYDGVVRVFPAMPSDWNGAFRLKAVGGLLVEAIFKEGKVGSLKITSERGGPLRIELPQPDKTEEIIVLDGSGAKVSYELQGDEVSFITQEGKSYWVTTQELLKATPQKVKFSGEPNRTPKVYSRVQIGK
ncbi:MAG: glycoside hydrolase family 95-like protein, partial [Thermodesulfobacteriota bacterium]